MRRSKIIIGWLLVGFWSCCPKTDDCNCVDNQAVIACTFNYSPVHSWIIAVSDDGSTRIDSFEIANAAPFSFDLTEDQFKHRTVSFSQAKIIFRDLNTSALDSVTHYTIHADTITSYCDKCWIRKSKTITCTDIKSYELIFNTAPYYSNKITITH
ncbi:MAG: hypothetical protein JWO58_458 [Chitinophagaceae bacterium]|nr:hypothetical protein [Chitinophagaceae bacterium]